MNAKQYGHFFETLSPDVAIEAYAAFFNAASTFEDPFNRVQGTYSIYLLFQKMYDELYEPHFTLTETIEKGDVAYLRWEFCFALKVNTRQRCFEGVSRVHFDDKGKVLSHRDYWDAAANVYEDIPLVGWMIRLVRRKLQIE